jgi:hypothetical protein
VVRCNVRLWVGMRLGAWASISLSLTLPFFLSLLTHGVGGTSVIPRGGRLYLPKVEYRRMYGFRDSLDPFAVARALFR